MFKLIEPPSKLVYTWRWETDPKDAETLVTIQFKPKGKQTELSVTHEGFPTEGHVKDHESGWSESIAKLQAMFA